MSEKKAKKKLQALKLAEKLGNVSEACRRFRIDRTSFYRWKKRYEENGFEGLIDKPPIPKSHPRKTAPEIEEEIIEVSLEHPMWGCKWLTYYFRNQGILISSPTIQKILIAHRMGSRRDRLQRLEEKAIRGEIELSERQ